MFIKQLDKGIRLQILGQNPEFLPDYAFKLLEKNLNQGSPQLANISIIVNYYSCTQKY